MRAHRSRASRCNLIFNLFHSAVNRKRWRAANKKKCENISCCCQFACSPNIYIVSSNFTAERELYELQWIKREKSTGDVYKFLFSSRCSTLAATTNRYDWTKTIFCFPTMIPHERRAKTGEKYCEMIRFDSGLWGQIYRSNLDLSWKEELGKPCRDNSTAFMKNGLEEKSLNIKLNRRMRIPEAILLILWVCWAAKVFLSEFDVYLELLMEL